MVKSKLLEIKYPYASCFIDSTLFIIQTSYLEAKEIGLLIRNISENLISGNFKEVEKYDFITKIQKGIHLRRYIPKGRKRKVLSIGHCLSCGSTEQLTIDHIIPIVSGGTHDEENLQCLCRPCNRKKGPERG